MSPASVCAVQQGWCAEPSENRQVRGRRVFEVVVSDEWSWRMDPASARAFDALWPYHPSGASMKLAPREVRI